MPYSRRHILRTIGGTGLFIGASSIGLSSCDQMPESAVAPWASFKDDRADVREWVLAHALLAPNPHNLQPWVADLTEPDAITLRWDQSRTLPETDPFGRQILIGFGAFLELLEIAAAERGVSTEMKLFPEGSPPDNAHVSKLPAFPVAHIQLYRDNASERSALYAAIPTRRSCKEPYDMAKPLTVADRTLLEGALKDQQLPLSFAHEGTLSSDLRALTRDAMLLKMQTPRTLKESIDLTRIGADEITANPDGIDLHGPMFWWLKRLGLMTREKAMQPGTMAYQGGIDYALGWADATPSFGWLSTGNNSRIEQIAAGRAYVRLNLQASKVGVSMHPVSQLLQEYPEMEQLQNEFRTTIGADQTETVQMLFRLGYAETPPPSPRRPLDSFIRT